MKKDKKDMRQLDENEEQEDVLNTELEDLEQPEEVEEQEDTEEVTAPEQDEEVELPPMKLYQFEWDCGSMGSIEGLFVATDEELDKVIGEEIYFGEALGKHSNIRGVLKREHLAVLSDDQAFIEKLIEVMSGSLSISGYNPLDYYREN